MPSSYTDWKQKTKVLDNTYKRLVSAGLLSPEKVLSTCELGGDEVR